MPKIIDVPGQGEVEFPDEMSDQEIAAVLSGSNDDSTWRPAAPQRGPGGWRDSAVGAFLRGLRDPLDAGAQMLERLAQGAGFDTEAINSAFGMPSADQATIAAEQDYRQNWRGGVDPGFDLGRLAGGIAGTAPLAYAVGPGAGGIGTRLLQGAGTGAAFGALQPVTDTENFAARKAEQVGLGAAGGTLGPLVGAGVARVVRPNTRPQVQAMLAEGVQPTPGQVLGGATQRMEGHLEKLPFVGDAIRNARIRAVEEFNTATLNRVLRPITGKERTFTLGGENVGRSAIDRTGRIVSDAYDDLLPRMRAQVDEPFMAQLQSLRGLASEMPPDRAAQFEQILNRRLLSRFTDSGLMSGETAKIAQSDLRRLATQYRASSDPDTRLMGDALTELEATFRNLIIRNNPQHSERLRAIDDAYTWLLRVENAAGRQGSKEGVFSPAALTAATRQMDRTGRHRAYSRGNAPAQQYAEMAENVLGPKVPDSGTPYGIFLGSGMLGGLGYLASNPAVAASMAASPLAYTRPATSVINYLLTQRPELAGVIAQRLRADAPLLGAVGGGALSQVGGQ